MTEKGINVRLITADNKKVLNGQINIFKWGEIDLKEPLIDCDVNYVMINYPTAIAIKIISFYEKSKVRI